MAKMNSVILTDLYSEEERLRQVILEGTASPQDKVMYQQIADAICQIEALKLRASLLQVSLSEKELAQVEPMKVRFNPEAITDVDGNVVSTVNVEIKVETKEIPSAKVAYKTELERLNLNTNEEYYDYCEKNSLPNPIIKKESTIYSLNEDIAVSSCGIGSKVWVDKSKVDLKEVK